MIARAEAYDRHTGRYGPELASALYDDLDDAWFSFAAGVGVSGAYCQSLDERRRAVLRVEFERGLDAPDGSFRVTARAWAVRGRVPFDHD